jgi:aminoglycoside phosphotransferase (APT) family kinase protein
MRLHTIERPDNAFQQPVTAAQLEAMARRVFGARTRVASAVELSPGMYNTTYRVELDISGGTHAGQTVILRIAPTANRQFRIERDLMRNEHASAPYLAPIASLMPRTLGVDFTHDVIERDYLFQSLLPGVPAAEGLSAYPRETWRSFFRQLGAIARDIHAVRGDHFGPVFGSGYGTWSQAVITQFNDAIADLEQSGLDSADVRAAAGFAIASRATLDEITEPRLLHGDLWIVNVMIASEAPQPTIVGVYDCDRVSWGDPDSDWPLAMAARRPGTERDAFWDTYGPRPNTPSAVRRALIYRARDLACARLERFRLGTFHERKGPDVEMRTVLDQLSS